EPPSRWREGGGNASAVRFETGCPAGGRGPLRGFNPMRISYGALRFPCSAGLICPRRRRAGVWHWAVTTLPRSSALLGPFPSCLRARPVPAIGVKALLEVTCLVSVRLTRQR